MFRIGQKVVCVAANFNHDWSVVPNRPQNGLIYTIRGLRMWNFRDKGPLVCVYLEEIHNDVNHWTSGEHAEHPFAAWRFKPLIEKKTDTGMAILKKIASDVSNKQIVPIKEDVE